MECCYQINFEFRVTEEVFDDLTRTVATVVGVRYDNGKFDVNDKDTSMHCIGYRVDNDWLGGLRHPWELTTLPKDEQKRKELLDWAAKENKKDSERHKGENDE